MPRKEMAHTFKVIYEPEADGSAWNVSIPAVKGCLTWGRSLAEARRSIREALSLFEERFDGKAAEVAGTAVFDEQIRLPKEMRWAVKQFAEAREKADVLRRSSAEAARTLTGTFSLRDASELLGMSPEGVRKLVKAG